MLAKEEAEKVAASTNIYRPDWSVAQIMGVLAMEDIRIRRTFPDTAHAMLAIALDLRTLQPTRLLESGPWWNARPNKTPASTPAQRIDWQTACAICLQPEHPPIPDDHDYTHPRDHAQAVTARREREPQ